MPTLRRRLTALALVGPLAVALTACSGPAIATCEEFAAMGDATGLFVQLTDEQDQALRDALDSAGYDTSSRNRLIARTEVVAFCNIYDGRAGDNADRPITDAF